MRNSGFSLVELSIVLIILGLLTGGILGGQSLISAAELRSISVDLNKYQVAFNSFKEKYNALPGDMSNAVRFWGAAAGGTADGIDGTCIALGNGSPSTGTETCNGNGDGYIETVDSWATIHEVFRLWQHLGNAGMIEGTYTGVPGPNTVYEADIGINVPASKYKGGGFAFLRLINASEHYPVVLQKNALVFGLSQDNWIPNVPILKPEDAWNIDTKIDDGTPGKGKITTMLDSHQGNCAGDDDPDVAAYELGQASATCSLAFEM
jgi:prepilin-type N-terminal cleavage/methylation domain-containing protein